MIIIEISASLITNDVFLWVANEKNEATAANNMTIHKLKRNWRKKEKKKIVFEFDRIHKQIDLNIYKTFTCLLWSDLSTSELSVPMKLCVRAQFGTFYFFSLLVKNA